MGNLEILPGRSYSVATTEELAAHFTEVNQKLQHLAKESVVGIKPIRFASTKVPVTSTTAFTVPSLTCPAQGFVWSIVLANAQCTGLTHNMMFARSPEPNFVGFTGNDAANPDTMQYLMSTFNTTNRGSYQALTFSKGQMLFNAGEYPCITGMGGLSASIVMLSGIAVEVPAEMVGKLLM